MKSPSDRRPAYRLAFRVEDTWWTAYCAQPDTMAGAIEVGRIRMVHVVSNVSRKRAFMHIMWEGMADLVEEMTGTRPAWGGELSAPEHEQAGSA